MAICDADGDGQMDCGQNKDDNGDGYWDNRWRQPGSDKCTDNGNDCCANAAGGEPATCAPGYEPSTQPRSWSAASMPPLSVPQCSATRFWRLPARA